MRELAIKVCGMKNPSNIAGVAVLNPDYMGFILYKGSPRYIEFREVKEIAGTIPSSIMKVAVLVDEPIENAIEIARSRVFDFIQLHGNETVKYCMELSEYADLIKAFRVLDALPRNMHKYESFCKMFILDTAGQMPGGTGLKFDHSILSAYDLETRYLLGGGISACDADYLRQIKTDRMIGVDINSRFELESGIKDINLLRNFITNIRKHYDYN